MQELRELDVTILNLTARCPARLHQRLDDALYSSLSKGLVLGHQVPVWCVLPRFWLPRGYRRSIDGVSSL